MILSNPDFRLYPYRPRTVTKSSTRTTRALHLHLHNPPAIITASTTTSHNYSTSYRRLLVTTNSSTTVELQSSDIIRNFYDGINRRDLASVEDLIALNCVYEDLVFPRPFVGRQAILKFFKQFIHSISADLQFAIDDISEDDTSAIGVTWHLEWKGKPFPFSKGCSFYRLEVVNGQKQIVYGRDCVEPAIKPGETALVAIRGVTWLLQKLPFLADGL